MLPSVVSSAHERIRARTQASRGDVRFVQELLGHSSLVSTQIYTRVAISKLRAVHAATHPGATLGRPPDQEEQESPPQGPESESGEVEGADPSENR